MEPVLDPPDASAAAEAAPVSAAAIADEVALRRTFGIISHPDAGKTTLTEQLLLLGGAIHLAGDVRARKTGRQATSDWMAIEKERGISVTSSVMRFAYGGRVINLLDTPGHEDFSEDTYRVLTAVDSALMVIDSVKGVESRTKQLMDVCRMRDTPILTFINKLDREGRDGLDLLDDIETSLGIEAVPVTWPVGKGSTLKGLYHLLDNTFIPYDPHARTAPIPLTGPDDPKLDALAGSLAQELRAEVELLQGAGTTFSEAAYLAGRQTPVFFGSAIRTYGVRELLDLFVVAAPAPLPRATTTRTVQPDERTFTGVVFKIQANMDPAHRDRMAFVRVCSGRFERGLKVRHERLGRELRLANATAFFAQDRSGVEEAFAGDIIGLPNHGTLRIGDTLTEGEVLQFTGIPSFAPEHFRRVRIDNALKAKQLEKGLLHLTEEGAIQRFRPLLSNDHVLGGVGVLQFEVVAARLAAEYGVDVRLDAMPLEAARWVEAPSPADLDAFVKREAGRLAYDHHGDLVLLVESDWWLAHVQDRWPGFVFHNTRTHA